MAVNHPPAGRPEERSLRIAMVVPPWLSVPPPGYGGLEQVVAALVDALCRQGHAVTLFGAGGDHGTAAHGFVSTVAEVQYERLGESLPELAHLARVNRLISAADFDVIHDHTTIGPLVAGRRAVPTVATVHGNPVGEYGDVLERHRLGRRPGGDLARPASAEPEPALGRHGAQRAGHPRLSAQADARRGAGAVAGPVQPGQGPGHRHPGVPGRRTAPAAGRQVQRAGRAPLLRAGRRADGRRRRDSRAQRGPRRQRCGCWSTPAA